MSAMSGMSAELTRDVDSPSTEDENSIRRTLLNLRKISYKAKEDDEKTDDTNPLLSETVIATISMSNAFENCGLVIILLNASWIGIDLDYSPETNDGSKAPKLMFTIVENIFCFLFSLELAIRILAYKTPYSFFIDPMMRKWNNFDFVLVALMVIETWLLALIGGAADLSSLSSLRLLRLLRISRVFRLVPELGMMVKSMAAAVRSVSGTFILIIGNMYVFGIVLTQWGKESGIVEDGVDMEVYFGSIPDSFLTLMQLLVFDDTFELIRACMHASTIIGWILIFFIIVGAFTILNMLIGVLCEVVANTCREEREKILRAKVSSAFLGMDDDGNGVISRVEFEENIAATSKAVGIPLELLGNAFEVIDIDGTGEIDHKEFVEMVFKLLNPPESKEIVLVQKRIELMPQIMRHEVRGLIRDELRRFFEEGNPLPAKIMAKGGSLPATAHVRQQDGVYKDIIKESDLQEENTEELKPVPLEEEAVKHKYKPHPFGTSSLAEDVHEVDLSQYKEQVNTDSAEVASDITVENSV
ncbi:hypothetical protein CYMTET_43270 [Cymbomonas tetramitiformis]|uniref:EF-hand domain-containing protein n=1 Tax=Cymbomonas tetramitiformis TaxID=36881 RepID=A0AAE0C3L7_9CHLO|nr:hypothetical protein CYMTET_43270 [Cymbomonas tetramitiformis]